jgi:hypothetical protein
MQASIEARPSLIAKLCRLTSFHGPGDVRASDDLERRTHRRPEPEVAPAVRSNSHEAGKQRLPAFALPSSQPDHRGKRLCLADHRCAVATLGSSPSARGLLARLIVVFLMDRSFRSDYLRSPARSRERSKLIEGSHQITIPAAFHTNSLRISPSLSKTHYPCQELSSDLRPCRVNANRQQALFSTPTGARSISVRRVINE